MSRPTGRRSSTWRHGVPIITWPSTPRKPKRSLWTSERPMAAHTAPSVSMRRRLSPVSSFWVSTSLRTPLGLSTLLPWFRRLTSVCSF
ncbi:hypothetical protein LDENG_00008490 [Lucifuga dentata]|nr:hypothetical protein LDENG_00008490 [Lucifuga dentata]